MEPKKFINFNGPNVHQNRYSNIQKELDNTFPASSHRRVHKSFFFRHSDRGNHHNSHKHQDHWELFYITKNMTKPHILVVLYFQPHSISGPQKKTENRCVSHQSVDEWMTRSPGILDPVEETKDTLTGNLLSTDPCSSKHLWLTSGRCHESQGNRLSRRCPTINAWWCERQSEWHPRLLQSGITGNRDPTVSHRNLNESSSTFFTTTSFCVFLTVRLFNSVVFMPLNEYIVPDRGTSWNNGDTMTVYNGVYNKGNCISIPKKVRFSDSPPYSSSTVLLFRTR